MTIGICMKGSKCTISGHLTQKVYDISRKLLGYKKWDQTTRTLFFDPNTHNLFLVCNSLPDAILCLETSKKLNKLIEVQREEEQNLKHKDNLPPEALAFKFKTKPYDHQLKAFILSKDKKYFAYLMEMGTGKTKVAIDNAAYLYSKGEIDTLVIIAPNGVHRQWVDEDVNPETEKPLGEVKIHMPVWVDYEMFAYKSGMNKKHKAKLDQILAITDMSSLRIISMNIEALSHKSGVDFLKHILSISKSMMVLDESSRVKNIGSKRTKNIIKLGKMAEYRRIMSGSPVTQGLEDLYSQLLFLSWEILGLTTFTSFKQRYCDEIEMKNPQGISFKKITGYRNEAELKRKVDAWSFQARKDECLDLPEIIFKQRFVELSKEQSQMYNALKSQYILEFENSSAIVDASLAVTRLMFMQRIICGHLKDDEGVVHRIPEKGSIPRVDVCMEVVEEAIAESDGKIIIWCRFKHDYKEVAKALEKKKIKFVSYLGKNKNESLFAFKTDIETKVMISNPKSGGIGLNITEANTMIYYSNSFEAETRWQSIARTHRSGQKRKVTCIDLVSKGTVDEKILNALNNKQDIADIIIDNPNKFLK